MRTCDSHMKEKTLLNYSLPSMWHREITDVSCILQNGGYFAFLIWQLRWCRPKGGFVCTTDALDEEMGRMVWGFITRLTAVYDFKLTHCFLSVSCLIATKYPMKATRRGVIVGYSSRRFGSSWQGKNNVGSGRLVMLHSVSKQSDEYLHLVCFLLCI